MRCAIVHRALDPASVLAEVSNDRHGAHLLFVGTVRDFNDGEPVAGLDYTAYTSMAERELADIVAEACERWAPGDVVVEHRIGTLGLGEASVVIAVGHPHRAEAYEASRYVIEELKRRLPVWKREHYTSGRSDWVHASEEQGRQHVVPPRAVQGGWP